MTNGEILTSYRQAKDKSAQIGVLAELNDCSWEEIADALAAGGVTFEPKGRSAKKGQSKYDFDAILGLAEQGYSTKQIAEHFGYDVLAMRSSCARQGISFANASGRSQPPEGNKKRTSSAATEPVQVPLLAHTLKQVHSSTETEKVQGLSMINSLSLLLDFIESWLGQDAVSECGARGDEAVLLLKTDGLPYRLTFERLEGAQ